MSRPATLHFDLQNLAEFSRVVVRRAAAFLAIGMNSTSDWKIQNLILSSGTSWNFFPSPISDELLQKVTEEFRSWLAGNVLQELDAGFNTFLDRAWNTVAWSKLHGTQVRSNYQIETIDSRTNISVKYEMVMKEIGASAADVPSLQSLSKLRNCLTHSHGVVTARHTNIDGALAVRWRGLEMRLQQGESYVVIPRSIPEFGIQAPDPTRPADVVAAIVNRKKIFPIGTTAVLAPEDLHEICWNQLQRTDEITSAILADMRRRGISEVATATPRKS